jgi:hypothetical protein
MNEALLHTDLPFTFISSAPVTDQAFQRQGKSACIKKQMGLSARSPYRNMKWRFVSDLFIHPRDLSVVISTYGRGIWVLDDVSALR